MRIDDRTHERCEDQHNQYHHRDADGHNLAASVMLASLQQQSAHNTSHQRKDIEGHEAGQMIVKIREDRQGCKSGDGQWRKDTHTEEVVMVDLRPQLLQRFRIKARMKDKSLPHGYVLFHC